MYPFSAICTFKEAQTLSHSYYQGLAVPYTHLTGPSFIGCGTSIRLDQLFRLSFCDNCYAHSCRSKKEERKTSIGLVILLRSFQWGKRVPTPGIRQIRTPRPYRNWYMYTCSDYSTDPMKIHVFILFGFIFF